MNIKPMFAHLQEVQLTDNDFKKEWNDTEFTKVYKKVYRLFSGKFLTDHRGDKRYMSSNDSIDDFFGLPYTSSSSFAMISNTNTQYYIDTDNSFNIEYFALTNNGDVVMAVWDTDENEKLFIIK